MQYTNVVFDFNVVKTKERNGWGHALNALVAVTKRLPLPANPFADGFRFFAEYANSAVDLSVQEKMPNDISQGNVRLSFSPDGKCPTHTFESTGTIAIIFGTAGTEADGFIDIGKIDGKRYCFESQLKPAFVLKFGRTTGSTCVPTSIIRNDCYGFFLNAIPEKVAAAPNLREDRVSEPLRGT